MKHSYETGVNKKMVFFRMLHSDFSRMIKSWKFYLTIAFIAVLTFLSIYPEWSEPKHLPAVPVHSDLDLQKYAILSSLSPVLLRYNSFILSTNWRISISWYGV